MSIKKQLAAYYDKQGLTGKHRRKAMQHDLRIIRNSPKLSPDTAHLHARIDWSRTPGGYDYWLNRSCGNGR